MKTILIFLLMAGVSMADEPPEFLFEKWLINNCTLEFRQLPVGPGFNAGAYLTCKYSDIFSPVPPPEVHYLGPLVWHGGELRVGGMMDGWIFVPGAGVLNLCGECFDLEQVE